MPRFKTESTLTASSSRSNIASRMWGPSCSQTQTCYALLWTSTSFTRISIFLFYIGQLSTGPSPRACTLATPLSVQSSYSYVRSAPGFPTTCVCPRPGQNRCDADGSSSTSFHSTWIISLKPQRFTTCSIIACVLLPSASYIRETFRTDGFIACDLISRVLHTRRMLDTNWHRHPPRPGRRCPPTEGRPAHRRVRALETWILGPCIV
jgi:hypothetical protein